MKKHVQLHNLFNGFNEGGAVNISDGIAPYACGDHRMPKNNTLKAATIFDKIKKKAIIIMYNTFHLTILYTAAK